MPPITINESLDHDDIWKFRSIWNFNTITHLTVFLHFRPDSVVVFPVVSAPPRTKIAYILQFAASRTVISFGG